jgi:hypothetical protein
MARVLGVLGAIVALMIGAQAARGQDAPLVGEVVGAVHTDGASLAAWQESNGSVVVLADAVPADRTQTVEPAERCPLQAVSRRLVGLMCADARPALFDVLEREARQIDGLERAREALATRTEVVLAGLGDRWLRLVAPDREVLLDWTSGRVRTDLRAGPRKVLDLSTKSAKRRLCKPLRTPAPGAAYRPPYLLTRVSNGDVTLRRCGSEEATVLTRDDDAPFVLSARFAAWAQGATVRVRDHSSERTLRWRTPLGAPVTALRATDRRVFVEVAPTVAGGPPTTYVLEPRA